MPLTTDERPSEQSEGDKPTVSIDDTYHASFVVEILKAEESDDGDLGHVEAIVSAFDVDYRMGWREKHRITSGAFKASLAKSASIPIFFQHNWSWSEQPPIGTGLASVIANPKPGLKVASDFFLDTESGRSTFKAIKAGALREWSIGYRITKYEVEEDDDGFEIVIVNEADLMEASSVLRGANPDTETLMVAAGIPSELMNSVASFMQTTTEALAIFGKTIEGFEARVTGLESAHEVLIGSIEDGSFKAEKAEIAGGETVEPAVGGGSDAGTEAAAPQTPPAPDSPSVQGDEADRLDRAYERAVGRVTAKWENFVEQAGAGLANPDADLNSREDIAAMERVLRCLNKSKYEYDAVEHRVTARVLAEESASATA